MLDELRQKIHHHLIDELGPILYDKRLSEDDLRRRVHEQLQAALAQERAPLSAADKAQLIQDVSDDILGYGPIDRLLQGRRTSPRSWSTAPTRSTSSAAAGIEQTDGRFVDEAHLRRIIDKIVGAGRPAHRRGRARWSTPASPTAPASTPSSRRSPSDGPFLTIRKFSTDPYQVDDLIRFGTLNAHAARFLQACVVGRLNVIVSGGTGTGKTTTLNVLSSFIPHDERIVTIEDAAELQLHQDHVLAPRGPPAEHRGPGRGHHPRPGQELPCACGPTASSSARSAPARPSTCSRP